MKTLRAQYICYEIIWVINELFLGYVVMVIKVDF